MSSRTDHKCNNKKETGEMDISQYALSHKPDDFIKIEKIGDGSYGNVYKVKEKLTGDIYAMKVCEVTAESRIHLRNEICIHGIMTHPNIPCFYGWIGDDKLVYLFFEYIMGRDLHALSKEHNKIYKEPLGEHDVRLIIRQLLDATEYVHSKGYIHRDIKAENVMVCSSVEDGINSIRVYLIDFGLAIAKEDTQKGDVAGTIEYFSPEIMFNQDYDEKIDIWSIGILMVELLTGELPFDTEVIKDIATAHHFPHEAKRQSKEYLLADPHISWTLSRDCQELIRKLLTINPTDRITIDGIRQSSWIRGQHKCKD